MVEYLVHLPSAVYPLGQSSIYKCHNFSIIGRSGQLKGNSANFQSYLYPSELGIKCETQQLFSVFSVYWRCSLKISCSSWKLWHHWFQEELQTVYPLPFPLHSRRASAMLVLRGFPVSAWPKTPCYLKLHNIKYKKCSNATDNNLGELASTVYCDGMHPGTCRHCKSGCVSRTTQKTQLSLPI